jgi:hypothetical protein
VTLSNMRQGREATRLDWVASADPVLRMRSITIAINWKASRFGAGRVTSRPASAFVHLGRLVDDGRPSSFATLIDKNYDGVSDPVLPPGI